MYPAFVRPIRALLERHGLGLVFLDVGSRNGVLELADVAPWVDAWGFEPNPVEYEKLMSGRTDAAVVGYTSPPYRSLRYAPFAIADRSGEASFYVTKGSGAAGMLEPNLDLLRRIRWKGRVFARSFADDIFTVERVVPVQVRTLREFASEHDVQHIDYLKIDVEGSEHDVLTGAGHDLLRSTGVIKVEVCFIEFRKGQKLFSDVDRLLRDHGFELLRYEILPEQIGLKERTSTWSFGPSLGFPERYGQPLSADAMYVNRGRLDRSRALAQAVVLIDKNYLDEALAILRSLGVDEPQLLTLLATYRGSWAHRIADLAVRLLLRARAIAYPRRAWMRRRGWRTLRRRGVLPPGVATQADDRGG